MVTDEQWNPEPVMHPLGIALGVITMGLGVWGVTFVAWADGHPLWAEVVVAGLMLWVVYAGSLLIRWQFERRGRLRKIRANLDRMYEIRGAASPAQLAQLQHDDQHYLYGRHRTW